MCCVQETCLKGNQDENALKGPHHRFFIRGFETYRLDREGKSKGGLITLVRNSIPAVEIQRSGRADLDTEYLGVRLILPEGPVTVYCVYSSPTKPIELDSIAVHPESWIMVGYFNSHSPGWGYQDLIRKGEDLKHWTASNQLILINRPDDPPICYSRA